MVRSGKAAIAYRVVSGVMLASGDPLGDPEAWPGAIPAFLAEARRHAWIPAVLGCRENAGTVWVRETGISTRSSSATRRSSTPRPSPSRVGRCATCDRWSAGSAAPATTWQPRRLRDIDPAELQALRDGRPPGGRGDIERGYSMALGRFADPADADCVVVAARQDGVVRALLRSSPWGRHGLSLDLMRRDHESDPGVNELLIVAHPAAGRRAWASIGSRSTSPCSAPRSARGERIGAGPVVRAWRRVLLFASRWAQIESLYRFNAKFQPVWSRGSSSTRPVGDLPGGAGRARGGGVHHLAQGASARRRARCGQ